MGNKDKNIRLTFYVVCGLLLGAPYIWKIIKLIPELLKTLPNAAEILASTGYTVLIIASLVVAFKLCEPLWLRVVGIYSTVGLIVCLLSMLTQALGANDVFAVLFEIVCAPFYGVDSPIAVAVIMLVLTVTSYAMVNRVPEKKSAAPAAPADTSNPAAPAPQKHEEDKQ